MKLSSISTLPGGAVTAQGRGCAAGSPVVLSVDGQQVAATTAGSDESFRAEVQVPHAPVGRYVVVASCQGAQLTAPLNLVVAASVSAAPAAHALTAASVLCFFVLLIGLVLRGPGGAAPHRKQSTLPSRDD